MYFLFNTWFVSLQYRKNTIIEAFVCFPFDMDIMDYIYIRWMRSSLVVSLDRLTVYAEVASSDIQHLSILRHSGIWGAADEAVLNTVHRRKKNLKNPPVLHYFTCNMYRSVLVLSFLSLSQTRSSRSTNTNVCCTGIKWEKTDKEATESLSCYW